MSTTETVDIRQPRPRLSPLNRPERRAGYLFLLPNFVGFLIFTAIPVFGGFAISLTDFTGFGTPDIIGFENYVQMFSDTDFLIALRNNFFYSFTSVPLTILFALLLALALNTALFGADLFKTIYFFPNLTSMVAVGVVWLQIFEPSSGPLNQFLVSLGIENPPRWFWSTETAMISIVVVVVWRQAGFYMVMFLGGLKTIPETLYQAADIDGANTWQKFWHVTWPMLSPTTFMITVLCFIGSFQVFDIINVTTESGPGRATTVIVYRIYNEAFRYGRMGYAASIGYILFLIIFIVTLIQWRSQKGWVSADQ